MNKGLTGLELDEGE